MEKFQWTRPYCGYSYLKPGWPESGRILKTVCDRGSFVEADVLNFNSPHPFTPVAEKTFRGKGALERAKRWLEKQYL